uniref:Glutamine--scyllo-inositol transaminase n=1 Tax=uncultured marine thaumarchaeote KM3_87_G04 TaxID=1456330 RepID=A0A075HVT5_9ARCH|nr:glutamine--scyllo-inositol transaminase [uncultured marine thaumarchaeote KM3_87_G04]
MNIPINIPDIDEQEIREVTSVLSEKALTSASFEGGKRVRQFEDLLSNFVKSKFAVAVNSGTSALQASLYALDIKPNDEVLIPSFTFVATANSVKSIGAKPVFVDILKDNFTMDPDDMKKKITKRTKAIIPVHLYGHVAYMKEIMEIAKKHQLEIIEDASQSLGSKFKGKHSGTFSRLGCFSMYAAKVMTAGEGGAIVTDDKKLFEKLKQIRNHGLSKHHITSKFGLNLRLPEINAAIAKIQMKKLPTFLRQRKKNAQILTEFLQNHDIILPKERKNEVMNWYLYTVTLKQRDKIMNKLNSAGIGAAVYYNPPIHQTPYYKTKKTLTATEWASRHVISLPIHPKVKKSDLLKIKKVLSAYRS